MPLDSLKRAVQKEGLGVPVLDRTGPRNQQGGAYRSADWVAFSFARAIVWLSGS